MKAYICPYLMICMVCQTDQDNRNDFNRFLLFFLIMDFSLDIECQHS